MKITANEAFRKVNALNLVPRANLSQATRVKVVKALVKYGKVIDDYRKECDDGLKKLKSEDFDEKMTKYAAALNPNDENREQADEQRAEAGFEEFKAEYDKVNADYCELLSKMADEKVYDVNPQEFSDADLEDIAARLPSGGFTDLTRDGRTETIDNDRILEHIITEIV